MAKSRKSKLPQTTTAGMVNIRPTTDREFMAKFVVRTHQWNRVTVLDPTREVVLIDGEPRVARRVPDGEMLQGMVEMLTLQEAVEAGLAKAEAIGSPF